MQKVSKAYKESMKSSLRERAYIMISFGLLNQEAQAKAKVEQGDFTYYSSSTNILSEKTDDTIYATLEENFTKVDGTMFFLPRQNASNAYLDTGIISDKLLTQAQFELTINLNVPATDFKGITINFGENYPVNFDLVSSNGQVVKFRNNTEGLFSTEEVLTNTTSVKLVVYSMKNPHSRVRIYSIRFGYGLVYYNDSVMASSIESYVSPIGADVPQIDFSVQLKNYDHYFNVDNPKSAINFLETGQKWKSITAISFLRERSNGFVETACCVRIGSRTITLPLSAVKMCSAVWTQSSTGDCTAVQVRAITIWLLRYWLTRD